MINNSVSIIIPVYNVETFIDRCIKSVVSQTYKNIEIILVDDGSPDNCPGICDTYAEQYDSVSVIHKSNGGLADARKAGFLKAKGEYILFVDSDDYVAEDMVEKMISSATKYESDLVICGYTTISEDGKSVYNLPYTTTVLSEKNEIIDNYILPLLGNCPYKINIPGFLWIRLLKRSLIQESFFGSEREYYLEDHYFDLLYADNIQTISIVNESLYYYCVNRESLSNRYRKDKWSMYKNIYQFYSQYIQQRGIADKDGRLYRFIISAVINSVDNAVLSGSYQTYKNEMIALRNDELVKRMVFSQRLGKINRTRQLYLTLLKFKQFRILYYIRKSRINKFY